MVAGAGVGESMTPPKCAECRGWVEIAADYEKRLTEAYQESGALWTTLRLLVEALDSGNSTAMALVRGCADALLRKVVPLRAEMVPCADCGALREYCGCDLVAALDEVWDGIVKAAEGCPVPTVTCQDRCGLDHCELDVAIRALKRHRAPTAAP